MWSVLGIPMCVNAQEMLLLLTDDTVSEFNVWADTVPFTTPNMMAPRMKRARTAASAAAATPKLTLRGGIMFGVAKGTTQSVEVNAETKKAVVRYTLYIGSGTIRRAPS